MITPSQTAIKPVLTRRAAQSPLHAPAQGIDDGATDGSLPWPAFAASTAFYLGRRQAMRDVVSSIPFVLLDVFVVLASLALASYTAQLLGVATTLANRSVVIVAVGLTLMLQGLHGLYPACGIPYSIEYRRLLRTCLVVVASLAGGLWLQADSIPFSILELSLFAVALILGLSSLRSLARHALQHCDWWTQPVLIVGDTPPMRALYLRLDRCRNEGLRPLGVLFDPQSHWTAEEPCEGGNFIAPICELESVLLRAGACRVAVADSLQVDGLAYHLFQGIPHVILPTELGCHPIERVRLVEHEGRVELHCHSKLTSPTSLTAKRLMDVAIVLLAIPVWLPVMIVIGLVMKLTDPGPIFFRQHRVGRFGKPFNAIKFRSMVCQADAKLKQYLAEHPELRAEWEATHKLRDDPRVTWIGNLLRKSSLDELPQVFSVLRGDMSLVGPRPIIDCSDYDRIYIDEHPEVFELYRMVRPGITGLWQISGRNSLPYRHRVLLDRIYLHNWSLTLDIFILWRTLKTAIFREGAY